MNETNPQKKQLSAIALILGIVSTALIILSMITTISGSVLDIQMFSLVAEDGEIEEMQAELETTADNLKDLIGDADESKLEEFEEKTGITVDDCIEIMRDPSLNSIITLAKAYENFDMVDEFGMDSYYDIDEEAVDLFSTFRTVIIVYALIIAVLMLLGTLLKNKVFTIISLVVSLLYYILFAGFLYLILCFALSIAHIVFLSKAKNA